VAAGIPAVTFWAAVPHYVSQPPNPKATVALLRRVEDVLDEAGDFPRRCNQQMVGLEKLEDREEIEYVRNLIQRHAEYTRSQRALRLLVLWEEYVGKFVKVMPKDYKRVLQAMKLVTESGLTGDEDLNIVVGGRRHHKSPGLIRKP